MYESFCAFINQPITYNFTTLAFIVVKNKLDKGFWRQVLKSTVPIRYLKNTYVLMRNVKLKKSLNIDVIKHCWNAMRLYDSRCDFYYSARREMERHDVSTPPPPPTINHH